MSRSPLQLALPFTPDGEDERERLESRLRHFFGGRLHSLVLTDNRSTFLSARQVGDAGLLAVRLHRGFARAPDEILAMVAAFCKSPRKKRRREALGALRAFFDSLSPSEVARPAPAHWRRGRHHDLDAIFGELNSRYFEGRLSATVTWGSARRVRRSRRRSRTLQLGSYCWDDDLIRVHPVLDHPGVPRFVVAAVVHHEMLHAAVAPRLVGGRRRVHTAEFHRRERQFEALEEADRWLDANLSQLLERRDRGAL